MSTTRPYHHGNLASELLDIALSLSRSGGPDAITIRAVTREAGVSPAAAYRHFADRESLLLAAAQRANARLAAAMSTTIADLGGDTPAESAIRRLRGVGLGYIRFAVAEPGWFALAFGVEHDTTDPASHTPTVGAEGGGPGPFDLLVGALDAMVEAGVLAPQRRPHAEWPCWSTVHGFAELVRVGPLKVLEPAVADALAHQAVDTIIRGLVA